MERNIVLLVDDNELTLRSMSKALQMGGIGNVAFRQPAEALKYFASQPDMILMTDYRMPVMNGVELVEAVRSIKRDTLCIIYTGYPEEIQQRSLEESGVKFFSKPLNIEKLINYIINSKKE